MKTFDFWGFLAPILLFGLPLLYLFFLRKRRENFASTNSRRAPAAARKTDAIILAILSASIVLLTQVTDNVGGFLSHLHDLAPGRAGIYWIALGLTLLLISGGIFLAWHGKARIAVGSLALVLCVSGAFFDSAVAYFQDTNRGWASAKNAVYTISLTDSSHEWAEIDGVDVWIGGQHLGKTSIKISVADFMKIVPAEMPEPAKTDYGRHAEVMTESMIESRMNPWVRFHGVHLADDNGNEGVRTYKSVTAYAQVELNGEAGFAGGSSGGSGGDDGFSTTASVYFPKRDAKIEQLLDLARLNDYEISEALLASLRALGTTGSNAIRSKLEKEPGFEAIAERLLPTAPKFETADDAWADFESILAKTDEAGEYATNSALGLRVARLAPHLDPEKLADRAVKLARRPAFWNFSMISGGDDFHLEASMPLGVPNWFSPQYLPPRALPIAHAIQIIEPNLESPNVFEERLTPELLRWRWRDQTALKAAHAIGGEAYDRFAGRQDLRREWEFGENGFFENMHRYGNGYSVNRWLWERLIQPGDEGRRFRKRHEQQLFAIMDRDIETQGESEPLLSLLVEDCKAGDCLLIERYWPRFKRQTSNGNSSDLPRIWFRYLARMQLDQEEAVERFTQTFSELARDPEKNAPWIDNGLSELEFLPEKTRIGVLRAMQAESLRVAEELDEKYNYRSYFPIAIPNRIETELCRLGDSEAIDKLILDAKRLKKFSNWLLSEAPDHSLVAEFAKHAEGRVRAIVPMIAAAHPTPRNRELLNSLERDPDPEVQRVIEDAQQALDELRNSAAAGN
ncbi:MAG: hypothetical protein ACI8UO_005265 [Verrucomicrobiales bacterium]|jgi:hypothetical protein